MKKLLLVCFVLVALLVPLTAVSAQACDPSTDPTCLPEPAPTPTDFVLPSYAELLLASVVGYLVTQGLKALGLPINGYTSQIIAGLTTGLIAFVNSVLQLVPAAAQEPVSVVFLLIASVLSAYGIHFTVKGKQVKVTGSG